MKVKDALQLVERLSNLNEIYDHRTKVVTAFVHEYFSELYEYEKLEAEISLRNRDLELKDREDSFKYLKEKRAVHDKYWSNKAQYYAPCSASSDPSHDWSRVIGIVVMETGDDDCPQYLFNYGYRAHSGSSTIAKKSFLVKLQDETLGFEHAFFG